MKKLLGIVVLGLFLSVNTFAEIRLIEEKTLKAKDFNYTIATVCVDGYKFVIGRRANVQSMVQFFEREDKDADMQPAEPARC